jgi:predicted 2-oxoglutarate/Fe(II)-dependent dioxygenase YbiX
VLFLNSQSDQLQPGTYSGGSLVFAGLLPDPRAKDQGFPLIGEQGLFVAFTSDIYHEIKPVLDGERYTVVAWFS